VNKTLKLGLIVVAAFLAAILGGWLWGSSGKGPLRVSLESAELRRDLLAARSSVLAARVALYNVNFGEASQGFEEARGSLRRVEARLKGLGRDEDARPLAAALTRIEEAQRMAGKLDQTANARAAEAVKSIDEVLKAVPAP
jgi:hypothetical protein